MDLCKEAKTDKAYNSFITAYKKIYDSSFRPKSNVIRNIKTILRQPWMTHGLLKSRKKEQLCLYMKFTRNSNTNHTKICNLPKQA